MFVLAAAGAGYAEKSVLGVNLNGPAPPPKPACWPRTAPVPMTSFSNPQQEAHMEVAPAWKHHKANAENQYLKAHIRCALLLRSYFTPSVIIPGACGANSRSSRIPAHSRLWQTSSAPSWNPNWERFASERPTKAQGAHTHNSFSREFPTKRVRNLRSDATAEQGRSDWQPIVGEGQTPKWWQAETATSHD